MSGFKRWTRWFIIAALLALISATFVAVAIGRNEGRALVVTPRRQSVTPPSLPFESGTDPAEVTANIMDEAKSLLFAVRVANKEISCENEPQPCNLVTDFTEVVEVLETRCGRIYPEGLRKTAGYRPEVNGRVLGAIESACHAIEAGRASDGEPRATAGWIRAIQNARAALSEVEADLR
ncbi:MAG: hypothetical protein ACM3XM_10995 [Mycobacterium leprae]